MGVIDRIFNEKKSVREYDLEHMSYSIFKQVQGLKQDFNLQRKWISHIHDFSLSLHKDHQRQKEATEGSIEHMKSWLNNIYYNQEKQQRDLEKVEESLTQMLILVNNSFSQINKRIEKLENETSKAGAVEKENRPGNQELNPQQKVQGVRAKSDIKEKVEKTVDNSGFSSEGALQSDYSLTNPENRLLNLLLTRSDPISYSKIAELTGHSINTVG